MSISIDEETPAPEEFDDLIEEAANFEWEVVDGVPEFVKQQCRDSELNQFLDSQRDDFSSEEQATP